MAVYIYISEINGVKLAFIDENTVRTRQVLRGYHEEATDKEDI